MNDKPRIAWRDLHGVVLIDKPVGPTSTAVLACARRLWRAAKGGHTGTLDPLASGILPLCFGAATKFSQVSLDADKRYRATLQLGVTRVGGDREGAVLRERPVTCDHAALSAVLARFVGDIDQVPPMHSALKHEGKPLYELARAGVEIERAARRVRIHSIQLVEHRGDAVVIDVHCSKGTYIRTLGEDIGEALGCGAHVAGLRRVASGALRVQDAVELDAVEHEGQAERDTHILPVDTLLAHWPSVRLDGDEAGRFLTGLRRRVDHADVDHVRVYGPAPRAPLGAGLGDAPLGSALGDAPLGAVLSAAPVGSVFLGAAHVRAGELIPDRLLSPIEVQASSSSSNMGASSCPASLATL
jgi:tRNA pseudouridine55 synthase